MRAGSARGAGATAALLLGLTAVALGGCAPRATTKTPDPRASSRAAGARRPRAPGESPGVVIGDYAVRYDGVGKLEIEAELESPGARFMVESGADAFVSEFEWAEATDAPPRWTKGARSDRSFLAPPCAKTRCRIRYRYALRVAARKLDDLDRATEEGAVLEAPPSTWLVAPEEGPPSARLRFKVATAPGTTFVTGVLRSPDTEGAWEISLDDLWTSPYSAFGPLRVRELEAGGSRLQIALAPGKLLVADDEIDGWVRGAAKAIVTYFGAFPLPEVMILLVPGRGRWIGEGKTLSGGGGGIFVRIGEVAPERALEEDWVLVHEMVHLAFPSVPREHDWAEEGLATYVEPFARARAGTMTAEDAWQGLVEGLPNGLPGPGDRGLDRTPTWGRTYWGGCLFYLLADIEIRKRTGNELGLEHALRGIVASGGINAHRWTLDEALAAGDHATNTPVLRELHAAMGTSPHPVDLDALWRELGVVKLRGTVRFDDRAPLSSVRRAITTGRPR